ncbi:6-phosphogluconolactonase [Staphylococcus coagulans]|uniref:6-phosphogluconolactonase n=1 Tax=Staphylococcus coagulans TaxID=74706 RepID=UPI0030ED38FB
MTKGYIGSYTKKNGKGIYRFELDDQQGNIDKVETGYELNASTYLTQYQDMLLAITKDDQNAGLASFKISKDGSLEKKSTCLESFKGSGCYVAVSPDGKYAFEAVYGDGVARIYELDAENHTIKRLIREISHDYPHGPNVERQEKSHVHYLDVTPDHQYVVAVDLGSDLLVTYHYGSEGMEVAYRTQLEPGDGPRHIAYHQTGRYAYVVNELSNTVVVMQYEDGRFTELERHLTIPEDFLQPTKLAAVHLSHDQRYLYISNRGHDSLAIFKVLAEGSKLELVDIISSGGVFPRDFNITADDAYLVVAHQEEDSKIVVFERNRDTGLLTLKDDQQVAEEGVCVNFLNETDLY